MVAALGGSPIVISPLVIVILSVYVSIASTQTICNPTEPCPAESQCNPHTGLCVKDIYPIKDRPTVWLDDTEEKCSRTKKDCAIFGMEYAGSHPQGRSDTWCQKGEIVRCMSSLAPPLNTTSSNEFRAFTYNVWERAFWVTNDGQRERTCRIPEWIVRNHPDVDVIGLQEVFMGGCFAQQLDIRALFCHYGFCHSTQTVDEEGFAQPGGIFIVSRWPILGQDQLVYEAGMDDSADYYAAKGVSYAKIVKDVNNERRTYHFMTTHMQSGGRESWKSRESQAGEWGHWLSNKNVPKDEAVIMSGDLNSDWYAEKENLGVILANIGGVIPEVVGTMNVTTDPALSDVNDLGGSQWLDWVVYRQANLLPNSATQEALYPLADNYYPACWCELCITLDPNYKWPEDEECQQTRIVKHLSDHFPVIGTFVFP